MQAEIRPAAPEDLEGIAHVAYASWEASYHEIYGETYIARTIAEQYSPQRLSKDISRPDSFFFVATADGDVVGFIQMVMAQRQGELARLYVHPDWQGRKVGSVLLAAGEQFLRSKGIKRYSLYVHSRAPGAIAFYKKKGFILSQGKRLGESFCMEKEL